jgi:hypothetical protein
MKRRVSWLRADFSIFNSQFSIREANAERDGGPFA